MKLLITLPDGQEIDLLDDGPNGMEYICMCSGEWEVYLTELLDEYKSKSPEYRKGVEETIREMSDYYADSLGMWDENLQSMIGFSNLSALISDALITFAKI